ncbi:MAG: hypothetical protein ACLFPE_15965, partial [Bacteroidales bacterium]
LWLPYCRASGPEDDLPGDINFSTTDSTDGHRFCFELWISEFEIVLDVVFGFLNFSFTPPRPNALKIFMKNVIIKNKMRSLPAEINQSRKNNFFFDRTQPN